jgi:hypothetical protein
LKKWLISGGAEINKNLKLKSENESSRGIEASNTIKEGENIMFIPKQSLITFE